MHKQFIYLPLSCFAVFWAAAPKSHARGVQRKAAAPELLHSVTEQLTNVIVYDIFKPPVASRIYAYSYLAAYERCATGSRSSTIRWPAS
jgi:hypothetical protein